MAFQLMLFLKTTHKGWNGIPVDVVSKTIHNCWNGIPVDAVSKNNTQLLERHSS